MFEPLDCILFAFCASVHSMTSIFDVLERMYFVEVDVPA